MRHIWEPTFSYSWGLSDRLTINSKTSRFASIPDLNNEYALEYGESSLSLSYGVSGHGKIAGGYLFRYSDPLSNEPFHEHRLIEQMALRNDFDDRRIVHRFRLEQRFKTSGYFTRLRYRLSYDFPLGGRRLSSAGRYAYTSGEAMGMVGSGDFAGESRLRAGIGWELPAGRSIEVGVAYYTEDLFTGDGASHVLLLGTEFSVSR